MERKQYLVWFNGALPKYIWAKNPYDAIRLYMFTNADSPLMVESVNIKLPSGVIEKYMVTLDIEYIGEA